MPVPPWMRCAVLLSGLLLPAAVRAQQTIQPANASAVDESDPRALRIAVSRGPGDDLAGLFPIIGLTPQARNSTPSTGLVGSILRADLSTQLSIAAENIVFISCDPLNGILQPSFIFTHAAEANATAVLLYSTEEDSCSIDPSTGDYDWVYSMNGANTTHELLTLVESLDHTAYGAIAPRTAFPDPQSGNPTTQSQSQGQNQSPLGSSPSTAVAMIILYSITGVITALFLIIIITGAVRAHRHPERYGPRNGVGRPRQSRARGMARAMLETIPIVKFGDREADQVKPHQDVELAEGSRGSVDAVPDTDGGQEPSGPMHSTATDGAIGSVEQDTAPTSETQEEGIAAAEHHEPSQRAEETQGCSICTDDFEVGQDQRVLPCDHRFHPECVDPWLLNVSGTCPLCRIDLRPSPSRSSTNELDEHGRPIPRDGDGGLSPPLETNTQRLSVRRSIMIGLMGIRPERMSREERVHALRQYRHHQAAAPPHEQPEHETSTRQRLRNAFRIRTSRTGTDGQVQDVPEQPEPHASADSGRADAASGPNGHA